MSDTTRAILGLTLALLGLWLRKRGQTFLPLVLAGIVFVMLVPEFWP